jgi:hypothetical protein
MASTDYAPTAEQRQAMDLFASGSHLVVEAGAGTGKTSTLVLMAETAGARRGQYVAFNRAIVDEAGDRLAHTNCRARTAHSLAFGTVGKRYAHRLRSGRMPSAKVAKLLGLEPVKVTMGETASYLSPGYLAGHVMRGIAVFCNTADPEPTRRHLPYIEGIDLPAADGRRTYTNNDLVADACEQALTRAWADITDTQGGLRFTHDHYLKMWQLSGPRIGAEYVMFDEAQDASPVMLDVVLQQAKYGTQLVFVGDSQQQIYEWRGAVNALARIEDAERTLLTLSFRFGPEVAAIANGCLEEVGADLRIEGAGPAGYVREIAEPRAVLCRSNAEAVGRVLQAQADGRRPYLVGEGKEVVAFARAVNALRTDGWTSHPELACFTSWAQVQDYVATDPQGSELALLVKLVEQYGTDAIIEALSNPVPEAQCDLVISTAHKAKGCEWDTVQLATDFPEPSDDGLSVEEWRLLYVAVTRARVGLDITGVAALTADGPGRVDATVPDTLNDLDISEAEIDAMRTAALDREPDSGYGFRRPGLA